MTLMISSWVKVMPNPLVMDNSVKYYPDPILQSGVMAKTQILGISVR